MNSPVDLFVAFCKHPSPTRFDPPSYRPPTRCRSIFDGGSRGASFSGRGTRGLLERCEITRNASDGVCIGEGADTIVLSCR